MAGADADFIKFTPAADAEFLHYGSCKSIDMIPMTPDGKPTPALLTKAALESASIPQVIINAPSPDIKIHCNEEMGQKFIDAVSQKHFLFSFVISYTETCEIPGITVAGADADFIKFTDRKSVV